MTPTTVLALIAGALLVALTLQDAFEVVLLPRRVSRRYRFTSGFFRVGWRAWRLMSKGPPAGPARERFLGIFGPLAMLLLFSTWALGLILGFGLVQWGLTGGGAHHPSLASQLYLSGVTFFTVGYGDVTPHTALNKIVAVFEAGVGFGLIAVVIGYLPVLYQLFSRREAQVLLLDARAGSPPTAAVLLRRHATGGGVARLDELFKAWEVWGAELLESHLSYPMLAYYRSQHDDQSWLGALSAVLDASVLVLVGIDDAEPLQARMTFAILRQVVVEMARSLRIRAVATEPARLLDPEAYEAMIALLAEAQVVWTQGGGARDTLAAMRSTYAPLLQGLADYLCIPLPGLVPADGSADHWDQGPRGLIARRLVEGLSETTAGDEAEPVKRRGRRLALRLRRRLR